MTSKESHEAEHGNVLSRYTEQQVMEMGRNYAKEHDLDPELFANAAAVARSPAGFADMSFLSEKEKDALQVEATKSGTYLKNWLPLLHLVRWLLLYKAWTKPSSMVQHYSIPVLLELLK